MKEMTNSLTTTLKYAFAQSVSIYYLCVSSTDLGTRVHDETNKQPCPQAHGKTVEALRRQNSQSLPELGIWNE